MHTGEIEEAGKDIRGVAVHEASQDLGLARAGEILATAITIQLGGDIGFVVEDRGAHTLRGLDGARRLYAIDDPTGDRG